MSLSCEKSRSTSALEGCALGYNHDGSGTRVMRQEGSIVTSVHVRLNPDGTAFNDETKAARADPGGVGLRRLIGRRPEWHLIDT